MHKPVVAIVGRPNVGKSTFFNRCVGARRAIVDDTPGVTRDRMYHECEWSGHDFIIIDTGGLAPTGSDLMQASVTDQVKLAIEESDVIVFLVDAKEGVTGADQNVANLLRRTKKNIILAANKVDDIRQVNNIMEFYQFGLGEPMAISALGGSGGVGDLLDKVISFFPKENKKAGTDPDAFIPFDDGIEDEEPKELTAYSLAIVGKPNVGKSSIVNILVGHNRCIVADEPGTTRDAIDTTIKIKGKEITLIDTAGIRRKNRVDYGIEAFAVVRSLSAISRADVVALVLDVTEPITDQDQKIGAKIEEAGKPVVIVLNKWDLAEEKTSGAMNKIKEDVRSQLRHLAFAEIIFSSALTKQRLPKIIEAAENALLESRRRISTSVINQVMNEAVAITPPPAGKRGFKLRVYYTTQVSVKPPTFVMFTNDDKLLTPTYKTYLERKIREAFAFTGAPIRLLARAKERK